LPKSKPVLQPKAVAAIQPQPKQLPLPFPPGEGAAKPPETNKTEAAPYAAPKPVVTTDIDDKRDVAPVKPVLEQINRVFVPDGKDPNRGPSNLKGSQSLILKSRKPTYDPGSGLYKPVNARAASPKNADVPAKIKRMCFEGGELKPCK
jgi:hypothetical protein